MPAPAEYPLAPVLSIRSATLDDVDAVVALVHSAYRGQSSRAGWTTEADWIDGERTNPGEVSAIISGAESLVLLAEECGTLAASCQLENRGGGTAYFGMFAVRPDLQGKGTGNWLLAEAEAFARRAWRAEVMRMTVVNVRGELIDWYRRRGYRPTGETEPFPYDDPAFGIPRVPDLAFAVLTKSLAAPEV